MYSYRILLLFLSYNLSILGFGAVDILLGSLLRDQYKEKKSVSYQSQNQLATPRKK